MLGGVSLSKERLLLWEHGKKSLLREEALTVVGDLRVIHKEEESVEI